MTPLGHASVGYLASRVAPRLSAPGLVAGSVLPDIDFLLLPFAFFNQVHRVWTHNLCFVVLAALLATRMRPLHRRALAAAMLLGGALHLLADAVIDTNATNGVGVAILWPLSRVMFSPFNLVKATRAEGWRRPATRLRTLLPQLAIEAPFCAVACFDLARRWRLERRQPEDAP